MSNPQIDVTVALPTWESSNIIWLQLESLCRQKTQYIWELVVCEEQTPNMMGEKMLSTYKERLNKAGCVNITYLALEEWVPLSQKWVTIAHHAKGDSFVLAASDNYSPFDRLERSHQKMLEGYNWFDVRKGLFYNLYKNDIATYILPPEGNTGLFMCTKTKYMKKLIGPPWPKSGIDSWIRTQQNISPKFRYEGNLLGLHTDGANKISHQRKQMYSNQREEYRKPFSPPEQTIKDILPKEVLNILKNKNFG